ncbi:MAG: hypothetical protein Q9196_006050 [Gyalolechia fulgens]
MANVIKGAINKLFAEVAKTPSAVKRILNPTLDGGIGTRVYPPRTAKNDSKFGVRIDRGELIPGEPTLVRMNLQLNSNAENTTIKDLARKDSHKVVAVYDVDITQEANAENLDKAKNGFLDSVDE